MPLAFESVRGRPSGQKLSEILERGPLALEPALRCATDIASALREMHQDGRTHGAVNPDHIVIRTSGAMLLTPERRAYTDPLEDLSGFGNALYAMLTGRSAVSEEMRLVPAKPAILKGPPAVRAATMRVAERCLTAERDTAPDFQKILTEVRLLHVMAKQFSPETAGLHAAQHPQFAPMLTPMQPLDVFAGKAPPVINPPFVRPAADVLAPPVPKPPALAPPAPAPPPAKPPEQPDPIPAMPEAPAKAAETVPARPGIDSPATRRARGSHSRPILSHVVCPKCKGYQVRLSRPRTRFERFVNLLGIGVYRCHRCFYRYIPLLGRKIVRKSGSQTA